MYRESKPIVASSPVSLPDYKVPDYRKKRPRPDGGSGEYTAESAQSTRPRVATLDNGWNLKYTSVTELLPPVSAAGPLKAFYDGLADNAAEQLSVGALPSKNLAFKSGPFYLEMSSAEPIDWTFVINFGKDMLDRIAPYFSPLFQAEAFNPIWIYAAVQISMSLQI